MPPPNHDEFDIREEITHNDMVQDKGNETLYIYFHSINYIFVQLSVAVYTTFVYICPTYNGKHK